MSQTETDLPGLGTVIVLSVVWTFMTFFSITGNSLVCLALYRNTTLRTNTNMYLLALAISDLTFAILVLPFELASSILRQWPFGYTFSQFNGLVAHIWGGVSTGILTLTAVNRYFCVVKPRLYSALCTKKKTILSVIFITILTVTAGTAITFAAPVIYIWHPYSLYCRQTVQNIHLEKLVCFGFLGFFAILPISVVTYCYGNVYMALKRHNAQVVPSLQGGQNHGIINAQEINAARILFYAVVGFNICWMPYTVVNALEMGFHYPVPGFAISLYTVFCTSSAWINPIIYGIMNRAMRKEFLKILHCAVET